MSRKKSKAQKARRPKKTRGIIPADAMRAFKRNLFATGIAHLKEVDGRTALFMRDIGMLKKGIKHSEGLSKNASEISGSKNEIDTSEGPLVFLEKSDTERTVLSLVDAITSDDIEVRSAVLARLLRLENTPEILSPRSRMILQENRAGVLNDSESIWRKAAISIYDALNEDFLLDLAAMRQCIELHFEEGLEKYSRRIVWPSIQALDSIDDPVCKVTSPDIKAVFVACYDGVKSLDDALHNYASKFAHIPFSGDYSAAFLVKTWIEGHEERNVWDIVWRWANSSNVPYNRYHACQIFAQIPTLIPNDKLDLFWQEVSQVLCLARPEKVSEHQLELWLIRHDLAKHFCMHLECLRPPGAAADVFAAFSWWLADKVAHIFGDDPKYVNAVRERTISTFCEQSQTFWELGRPWAEPSYLRYCTVSVKSMWSSSLLSQLEPAITHGRLEGISYTTICNITHGMVACVMRSFLNLDHSAEAIFAFQCEIIPVINRWLHNDSIRQTLERTAFNVAENAEKSVDGETDSATDQSSLEPSLAAELSFFADLSLSNAKASRYEMLLANLSEANKADAVYSLNILRSAAYTGALPVDEVWNALNKIGWRTGCFTNLDESPLHMLFDLLCEMQNRAQPDQRASLAHYIADVLINANLEEDRREVLAGFVILASICTDTCSAITRILTDEKIANRWMHLDRWRDSLVNYQKPATPWVSARIRAVLPALSVRA